MSSSSVPLLMAMESHDLQLLMALFLTKPHLYAEHAIHRNREEYFFREFHKFARHYYRLDAEKEPDAVVYFHCIKEPPATGVSGTVAVGGVPNKVRSKPAFVAFFKRRLAVQQSAWTQRVQEFEVRHGIDFDVYDPRRFLGERQIWLKLHRADDLVAMSKWPQVAQWAYADKMLCQPLPHDVDIRLVPFAIRDRVCAWFTERTLREARKKQDPVDTAEDTAEDTAKDTAKDVGASRSKST
jgi:hypothetical protein